MHMLNIYFRILEYVELMVCGEVGFEVDVDVGAFYIFEPLDIVFCDMYFFLIHLEFG